MKASILRIALPAIFFSSKVSNVFTFTIPTQSKTSRSLSFNNEYQYQHLSKNKFEPLRSNKAIPGSNIRSLSLSRLQSSRGGQDPNSEQTSILTDLQINPPFAIAWVFFLSFAFLFAPGNGFDGPESKAVLESFFANPLHPENVPELFVLIFSLFTFIPISLACLIMPGARGQSLPATPFLMGASVIGYFPLGIYMSTRKAITSGIYKSDMGWFTSNFLENKLFNWAVFALSLSSIITTGAASSLINDFSSSLQGLQELISTTAIASVSTLDLSIMTLCAASMIPEDLKRRGIQDEQKANLIALSTLLLPVVGSCAYCALRPELPDES